MLKQTSIFISIVTKFAFNKQQHKCTPKNGFQFSNKLLHYLKLVYIWCMYPFYIPLYLRVHKNSGKRDPKWESLRSPALGQMKVPGTWWLSNMSLSFSVILDTSLPLAQILTASLWYGQVKDRVMVQIGSFKHWQLTSTNDDMSMLVCMCALEQ